MKLKREEDLEERDDVDVGFLFATVSLCPDVFVGSLFG